MSLSPPAPPANPAEVVPAPTGSMLDRVRTLYRDNRAFRWAADLGLIFVIVLVVGVFQTRKHLRGTAPSLPLSTLDGKPTSLEAYKGKKTLVYLWAPWCGVCKAESQNVAWVNGLVGQRANVISIATAYEKVDDVRAYVKDGVGYPVLVSETADRAFKVSAFPTVYFVDATGKITSSATGYTTTAGLLLRLMLQ